MGLDQIAAHINATRSSVEAGEWLIAAKAKVPYGDWKMWLLSNVGMSLRQAQRVMKIPKTTVRRFSVGGQRVTTVEPENNSSAYDLSSSLPEETYTDQPWPEAIGHINAARELITGFIEGVANAGKRSRIDMVDERLSEVADTLGYAPELLYTAAELLAQASEFPNTSVDYR